VPAPVREICAILHHARHEAFVVGGAIRDLLLDRGFAPDWDVATSAHPDLVLRLFPKAIPTGIAHGTVTVVHRDLPVEVTTFRAESGYADGRHPDAVVFLRTLEDDLARRDFTVNALALDVRDGSLRDPFGGAEDLVARRIRAVGRPRERLAEDGLRALRAVRFAATLEFAIDPAVLEAISETLPTIRRLARERVRAELEKLLAAPRPSLGLEPAAATGLLREVLPELGEAPETTRRRAFARADAAPADWVLRFAALHLDLGAATARRALERLRPATRDLDRVTALVGALPTLASAEPSAPDVRRALAAIGRERATEALDLWSADLASGSPVPLARNQALAVQALAREALQAGVPLSVAELAIGGDEVRAVLGTESGPLVGSALRALLDLVLADPGRNDAESLREHLRASFGSR
jgi:tRNA nucleotidyltransferase (CCA-adding enzyme)